jgi:hypothetical protein
LLGFAIDATYGVAETVRAPERDRAPDGHIEEPSTVTFLKRWWPPAAIVGAVILVQMWWTAGYDVPGGHASGHFMNATAIFGFTAAIAVLLWAIPAEERRQPVLWCLAALVLAAAALVTVANVRVVDAIGSDVWSGAEADRLGPSRPGFMAAHDLVDRANLALTGAAVALVVWMAWRRLVSGVVAFAAALVSVIGGVGVFVLTIAVVVGRARRSPGRRDAGRPHDTVDGEHRDPGARSAIRRGFGSAV